MKKRKIETLFRDYLAIHKIFYYQKKRLNKEIVKEYGFHYSDRDIDYIIDSLDYDQGTITFEEFDKIMKESNEKEAKKRIRGY